jgi:hypothetical protein
MPHLRCNGLTMVHVLYFSQANNTLNVCDKNREVFCVKWLGQGVSSS